MSASCSCDPEVAGIEYRARANSRDSWALWAAAKAGHADVCKLLVDPTVDFLGYFEDVKLDET
jgi:hypothetical protein